MRSFNKQNTENLKQERKKSKEFRKLRMNNGYMLSLIGDEDDNLKADKGTIKYRVHIKGGGWLGWMSDYNINDWKTGCARN